MGRTRVTGLNFDIDAFKFSETSKGKVELESLREDVFQGEPINEESDDICRMESNQVNSDILIVEEKEEHEYRC
jgi:hypothetical protein